MLIIDLATMALKSDLYCWAAQSDYVRDCTEATPDSQLSDGTGIDMRRLSRCSSVISVSSELPASAALPAGQQAAGLALKVRIRAPHRALASSA